MSPTHCKYCVQYSKVNQAKPIYKDIVHRYLAESTIGCSNFPDKSKALEQVRHDLVVNKRQCNGLSFLLVDVCSRIF